MELNSNPWIQLDNIKAGDFLTEHTYIAGKTAYSAESGTEDEIPTLKQVRVSYVDGTSFMVLDGKKIPGKEKRRYAPPGRFSGTVIGGKLLANVAILPYSFTFGPDWMNFFMSLALGSVRLYWDSGR